MMAELGSADTVVSRASLLEVSVLDSPVLQKDRPQSEDCQSGVPGSWGERGQRASQGSYGLGSWTLGRAGVEAEIVHWECPIKGTFPVLSTMRKYFIKEIWDRKKIKKQET